MTLPRWPGRTFTLRVWNLRLLWFRILILGALGAILYLIPSAQPPAVQEISTAAPKPSAEPVQPAEPEPAPPPAAVNTEDIARLTVLAEQERKAISEHYYRTGKVFYEKFQYREAAENFEKAVEADKDNLKARYLLNMSRVLLGDCNPDNVTTTENLIPRREARLEQQRQELARLYDQGLELVVAKKFDRALDKFEHMLEKIKWSAYNIDSNNFEERARSQIIAVRIKKREAEILEREELESRALQSCGSEPTWITDYKRILRSRRVSINLNASYFSDVVEFLQDITGLNLAVWSSVDQDAIRITLKLDDVVLEQALDLILEQADLTRIFHDETIAILPRGS